MCSFVRRKEIRKLCSTCFSRNIHCEQNVSQNIFRKLLDFVEFRFVSKIPFQSKIHEIIADSTLNLFYYHTIFNFLLLTFDIWIRKIHCCPAAFEFTRYHRLLMFYIIETSMIKDSYPVTYWVVIRNKISTIPNYQIHPSTHDSYS